MKSIYLLGAANPETVRMIRAVETANEDIRFPALLDNDERKHGRSFFGVPIIGGVEAVPWLAGPKVGFVSLVTGSTSDRFETGRDLVRLGGDLVNFVHPGVELTMTSWGRGNYVQEGVILQAGVSMGDNSSIHMASVIGHESEVGNSVFIAHAVSVSGNCTISDGAFIGTNSTILPRLRIGKWAIVGAGSVVTRDVPDYTVVVGNPARVVRTVVPKHEHGRVFA